MKKLSSFQMICIIGLILSIIGGYILFKLMMAGVITKNHIFWFLAIIR